ncbi:MAG: class I SAM-dependent methyltransferase [Candidatus Woesearchaeota archaeon]
MPLIKLGFNASSFDFTNEAIKATKENLKKNSLKASIKKANMYNKFPYNNKYFDFIICFQAIFHGRLEQIMLTLSEIKRILKKDGMFFATFLRYEDIYFDKNKKLHYFWVYSGGKKFKSWLKQDKSQPHLFYYLSKDFEYMVPHYYFSKNELKIILSQFFRDVKIKLVKKSDLSYFYLAYGKI